MLRRILTIVLLVGFGATLLVVGGSASAYQVPSPQASDKASEASSSPKPANVTESGNKSAPEKFSAARERSALKFVSQHHPELGELLGALKASNRPQYESAIEDVWQDRDRLSKLAEKDEERHLLSLEVWKLNSRLRLAVARFSMGESSGDVEKLVELMKCRNNARMQLFVLDRERLAQRLEKLDGQIDALDAETDEGFAKEIERLRKSVVVRTKPKAKTDRPVPVNK